MLNNKEANYQQQQFNYPRQQNPLFQPSNNYGQVSNNYLNFNDNNNFNQNTIIENNHYHRQKQPNKKELANQKMQSRYMIPNFSPAPIVQNNHSGVVP